MNVQMFRRRFMTNSVKGELRFGSDWISPGVAGGSVSTEVYFLGNSLLKDNGVYLTVSDSSWITNATYSKSTGKITVTCSDNSYNTTSGREGFIEVSYRDQTAILNVYQSADELREIYYEQRYSGSSYDPKFSSCSFSNTSFSGNINSSNVYATLTINYTWTLRRVEDWLHGEESSSVNMTGTIVVDDFLVFAPNKPYSGGNGICYASDSRGREFYTDKSHFSSMESDVRLRTSKKLLLGGYYVYHQSNNGSTYYDTQRITSSSGKYKLLQETYDKHAIYFAINNSSPWNGTELATFTVTVNENTGAWTVNITPV